MEDYDKTILDDYFSCLYNQQTGNNEPMQRFKLLHAKEYQLINGCYHKRTKLRKILEFMQSVGKVYFGCLTFNDLEDKKEERTKRRQAWRHLNDIFKVVVMVEEYGSLNGRYHIHFMGVFKEQNSMKRFHEDWHSFAQIEPVRSKKKVARYLCDYISKEVPRIRQNKALIQGFKHYQKGTSWQGLGFNGLAEEEKRVSLEVVDLISALS